MPLPLVIKEIAAAKLQASCERRIPNHLGSEIRLEFAFRGMSVTLYELRPPWHPMLGPQWTKMPVAQFRYDAGSGLWTLYWADRNSRWREDYEAESSRKLDDLIAEVEHDATGVYWG